MPARTNEFQQLVHSIHRLMEDRATVTESRFLEDRATGVSREVDIVVETENNGESTLTCIECVGGTRPANVEWVEQMIGKHADLPTHTLILVSRRGFSAAAIRKAEVHGVRTMRLKDAVSANWPQIVGRLSHVYVPFIASRPATCEINYARGYPESDLPNVPLETMLYGSDERQLATLEQIGMSIARNSEINKSVMMKKEGMAGEYPVTITYTAPAGSYVLDATGARHEVTALAYRIVFSISERFPVPLQHATLGDLPVAFGPLTPPGANLRVTIIEPEGQELRADVRGDIGRIDPRDWHSES